MAVYLTLTAVMLLIGMQVRQSGNKNGRIICLHQGMTRQQMINMISCLIIFVSLFLVSAMRLNVGNDYLNYVEFMHLIYCRAYVPTEIGFNALTYLVYNFCGFENYLLLFAIFAFVTIAFFMKSMYQQSEWFTLSFMMFMLLGYYFQSLSTVRYYMALSMALYSIKYVISRDWPRFVLLILVASTFHKSVLVVLLLYFVAQIDFKRWMYVAILLLGVSCFFLQDLYLKIVVFLYPSYKNTEYLSGGTSMANIVRCLAILAVSLLLYNSRIRNNRRYKFYFICNFLALVLYAFGSFLPVISRIGYYLTVTHVLFVPALVMGVKDERKRRMCTAAVVFICLCYFVLYMRGASADGIRILPYQTFLFHELPLTLSERGY